MDKLHQTHNVAQYIQEFKMYATVLNYGDKALRDKFYNRLKGEIKDAMFNGQYNPHQVGRTTQQLIEKALAVKNFLGSCPKSTTSRTTTTPTTTPASTNTPRNTLKTGNKVYMIGTDRKAQKGTITGIGQNPQGQAAPHIRWNNGTSNQVPFGALRRDTCPTNPTTPITNQAAPTPTPKSGPVPMELDGKNASRSQCYVCKGYGHFARECPSKPLLGNKAKVEEVLIDFDLDKGKGKTKAY